MRIQLPPNLNYPITVHELLKRPRDRVNRLDGLFTYSSTGRRLVEERYESEVEKWEDYKIFGTYDSSVDGELKRWTIERGMVIDKPGFDAGEIVEDCLHEVQYNGMCVNCGKSMDENISYTTDKLDTSRASIRMIHDNSALTVSQDEATRVEEEAKRRLLASRKLTLVVDLDQTIIHATVDPTVVEWQQDPNNPNHDAVKSLAAFQLLDDSPGARGTWYHIKTRPGLQEFLENISKMYELHIYTMGTRLYAQSIREIVDKTGSFFGDRILSRDESGSLTAKNLQRLFPIDTKMVVIIDDRGDVWKWNDNLIKVNPYVFFPAIGDINSSFLPKQPDYKAIETVKPSPMVENEPNINGMEGKKEVSALEQLVTMGGGDDPKVLEAQTHDQEVQIAAQMEDRPLLQQQKRLDAEFEAAEAVEASSDNGEKGNNSESDTSSDSTKHRHLLLQDNDVELITLEERLRQVHKAFFDEYDRRRAGAQGGRLSALRGERKASVSENGIDLSLVPDVKTIMPTIKRQVFQGAVVVLSGVIPLGSDIQNSDIAMWAKSFGAKILEKVTKQVTHVVAGRSRTAKVRQAAKRPHVHIVTIGWLMDSMTQWKWLDEEPYLVNVHPDDRQGRVESGVSDPGSDGTETDERKDEAELSGDEETSAETDEDSLANPGKLPKLVIKARSSTNRDSGPNDLQNVNGELEGEEPEMENVDLESPIGGSAEDWAALRDELDEFMGSDDDSDSDASETSNLSIRRRGSKRKRADESVEDGKDGGDEDVEDGSELSKRVKRVHERSTGLKAVAGAEDDTGGQDQGDGNDGDEDDEAMAGSSQPDPPEDDDSQGQDPEDPDDPDDPDDRGDEPESRDGGDAEEDDLEAALEKALLQEDGGGGGGRGGSDGTDGVE